MSSSPAEECRSPVGLDCCSCCLDLANRSVLEEGAGGENNNPGSPTVSSFRQLREQLVQQNLNTDKLSSIMRQDSLEPVVRDPCYLFNQGICNRNIDQTLLSILLLFHSETIMLQELQWQTQSREPWCERSGLVPARGQSCVPGTATKPTTSRSGDKCTQRPFISPGRGAPPQLGMAH
ncbi:TSC22 domain family protein 3 isoform X5 [Sylvia atricapilla]|uniref:TSC22 domain family protein 3 isoform X5 n=1 Tax=Sylvia atricapilla TaxID=48155 RepID=UPI0033987BF3